jgi:hypothetical protein
MPMPLLAASAVFDAREVLVHDVCLLIARGALKCSQSRRWSSDH